jgi:hypothetical protein
VLQAYVTNLGTRECKIYDITRPFISHEIPADAQFEGYETIGAYPDYVTLTQVCVCAFERSLQTIFSHVRSSRSTTLTLLQWVVPNATVRAP